MVVSPGGLCQAWPPSMWAGRLSRGPKKAPRGPLQYSRWSLCLGCPLVGSGSWVIGYSILVANKTLFVLPEVLRMGKSVVI